MFEGRWMAGVCGLCGWRIGSASLETRASYVLRYQVGWVRIIAFMSQFTYNFAISAVS
jgi:hypothetical protein